MNCAPNGCESLTERRERCEALRGALRQRARVDLVARATAAGIGSRLVAAALERADAAAAPVVAVRVALKMAEPS